MGAGSRCATAGPVRAVVPRAAFQTIGSRTVVYVAGSEEGRFVERTVKIGVSNGDVVEVLEGVKPGERVATEGSFLLRAETARVRGSGYRGGRLIGMSSQSSLVLAIDRLASTSPPRVCVWASSLARK